METFKKRQKDLARKEKRQKKAARKLERRQEKTRQDPNADSDARASDVPETPPR